MTIHYPDIAERQKAQARDRRNATQDARDARGNAQRAIWMIASGLADLAELPGVDRAFIPDTCTGLLDQASNIKGALDTKLDNVGCYYPLELDLEGVKELLRKIGS